MDELSRGIFRWTAPHPEWRTRIDWGHEVASFALVAADALVLIDPQLPPEGSAALAPLLAELDRLAGAAGRLEIMITVPYHARSAEPLYERYRAKLASRIWAHPATAKRFVHQTPFTRIEPGVPVAGLARAFAIGNPRRHETPLYFADHKALAFGDTVIGFEGTLRVWQRARRARCGTARSSCPRCGRCWTSMWSACWSRMARRWWRAADGCCRPPLRRRRGTAAECREPGSEERGGGESRRRTA